MEEDHHHPHDTERQELEAAEGEETPIMTRKDLEGSQMRIGEENGTRDQHPSQKKTTMTRKTVSLTCSHGSWPMPWDNARESQRNPLPCFESKNTKIYVCGYYHVRIVLVETVGNGKIRHNESDTP